MRGRATGLLEKWPLSTEFGLQAHSAPFVGDWRIIGPFPGRSIVAYQGSSRRTIPDLDQVVATLRAEINHVLAGVQFGKHGVCSRFSHRLGEPFL